MPIILGRVFLATRGVLINVLDGKLTLRVGEDKQEFNVFKSLKYTSTDESCL